jgi:hypothetical protein
LSSGRPSAKAKARALCWPSRWSGISKYAPIVVPRSVRSDASHPGAPGAQRGTRRFATVPG